MVDLNAISQRYVSAFEEAVVDFGHAVSQFVKARTRAGFGIGGAAFQPYSERWAKVRGKVAPVDLDYKGAMLGGLQVDEGTGPRFNFAAQRFQSGNRFQSFSDQEGRAIRIEATGIDSRGVSNAAKAHWHQFGTKRGLPARPWLGLSDAEQHDLFSREFVPEYDSNARAKMDPADVKTTLTIVL